MQTMTPVPFLDSTTLVDLVGVSAGPLPTLVTLDHGAQWHRVAPNLPPMEPALLRVWSMPSAAKAATETARQASELPYGFAAAMAVLDGRLAALVEANETAPAWLALAPWAGSAPGAFAAATPLRLDPAMAASVTLLPRHGWSTQGLQPARWMFHPSITPDAAGHRLILAMNTADGQAVIWHWSLAAPSGPPERQAAVPAALDPVAVVVGNRRFVLFRRMPPDWRVFFGDMRYSSSGYPVAMPLMMGELGTGGAVHNLINLSSTSGIGDVFAFATHGDATRITLAAAIGTRAAARLRLVTLDVTGQAMPEPAEAVLRAAPLRVALAQAESSVLVGVMYRTLGRSTVDAMLHHR
jgi:hypothetical protein